MNRALLKYSLYVATILIGSYAAPEYILVHQMSSVFIFALLLLLINMIVKPIVLLLTIPLTLLTIGLFSLVVNAWMIMLADYFVGGISLKGFWVSAVLALIITILNQCIKKHSYDKRG